MEEYQIIVEKTQIILKRMAEKFFGIFRGKKRNCNCIILFTESLRCPLWLVI